MKAKGFDFKQFAITHGEKVVLGIAGVVALLVLVKTTWGTYKKTTPAAMKKSAEESAALIASTKWPTDESRKYPPDDTLAIQIGSMLDPIPGTELTTPNGSGLAFTVSGTWPLYIRENPWKDPEYFPVRRLIATSFRPVIAKRSDNYVLAEGGGAEGDPMDPKNGAAGATKTKLGGFRDQRRGGNAGLPGGGPMGFGPGPMGSPATGARGYRGPAPMGGAGGVGNSATGARAAGPAAMKGAIGPMVPGMPGLPGGEGMGGGSGQPVEADGQRAVAVRGIFPIREQMLAYEKALHLVEGLSPLDYVRIYDFVLERAVSTDGGKTFGKWAAVDTKSNIEYLKTKVADFDPDIVAQGVTHYIITSPLPMRLLQNWGLEATHPELARYELSDEGRRRQRLINEAVQEQKKQMKKFEEETQSRGFGVVQRNMTGDRLGVLGDTAGSRGFDKYLSGMLPPGMGNPDEGGRQQTIDTLKAEANAIGDLVLFRYFDFDVLPGRTYKYRVKLVLHNPLFGQPVEKLALDSQGSNKKEYIHTGYSNATQPVTVKTDVDYFVDRITDWRSPRMDAPSVTMSVYEWMQKLGTVVKGKVYDLEPGQTIAGKDSKTKRLDPAREVLEINMESEFSSNSVLLDLRAGHPKLDDRHMRELGLSSSLKGKIAAPDQVLVVDELGRLKQLDPLSQRQRFSQVDRAHQQMITHFKNLGWEIDPANVTQTGIEGDPMEGGGLDRPLGPGTAKGKKGRGRRSSGSSPLRRGGQGGYGSNSGYGPNSGYGSNSGYGPMGGGGYGGPMGRGGYNRYGRPGASGP